MVDISKFKDLYVSESEDQLQILNENLLVLEKAINNGDSIESVKGLLDTLMRASHTIKGSSATMGFNDMAYLAHVMEDVYDGARNGIVDLTTEMLNYAYQAVDKLEDSLNAIKETDKELELKELAVELKKATGVNTEGVGKSNRKKAEDAMQVTNNTQQGTLIANKEVETKQQITEEIKQEIGKVDGSKIEREKVSKAKSENSSLVENEKEEVDDAVKKIEYIKVPIKRLDTLMDLVEEMVIDRMALQRMGLRNKELQEVTDHVGLLIQSLQYEVMQARLVPVEQVFARFPRMVRDLSKKQGKKVEFIELGSDLELDRSIVDKLGEPLVHLLRNAVDHGIATEGYVKLEAKRDRENALIIVENNDQSINIEKVRQAAVKRGIMSLKEIEVMNDQEVMNLLFHQRLSTNDEITEISGRGVGLNVVKSFAESSGGRVIVENLNPGARFTLELPLTLAIINSLLVEVGDSIYAIPFANIDRSVIVSPENIKRMADNDIAIVDGIKVSLVDLRKKFKDIFVAKVDADVVTEGEEVSEDKIVVIIKKNDELVGLVVDKLVGEQEVTVKPLSPILRNVKGFSGSTILGDGKTILILDTINLLSANLKK